MNLGIIPTNEMAVPDEKLLVDDDDVELDPSFSFGQLSTDSQPHSSTQRPAGARTQGHEHNAFSAERELINFHTQKNVHFQTCKLSLVIV